jgi:hypothetical protein
MKLKQIKPIVDNILTIYSRTAVYTCSILDTIDKSDFFIL